ncbi:hypothetical protein U9M48_021843 [Paspalum notatum var. saurae]|uniref:Uncharacterized protein n=1 Tax=Paspalum notatum var. saurae TaxID=547442 RepID=A0AAQ3TJW6_PASNO
MAVTDSSNPEAAAGDSINPKVAAEEKAPIEIDEARQGAAQDKKRD